LLADLAWIIDACAIEKSSLHMSLSSGEKVKLWKLDQFGITEAKPQVVRERQDTTSNRIRKT